VYPLTNKILRNFVVDLIERAAQEAEKDDGDDYRATIEPHHIVGVLPDTLLDY